VTKKFYDELCSTDWPKKGIVKKRSVIRSPIEGEERNQEEDERGSGRGKLHFFPKSSIIDLGGGQKLESVGPAPKKPPFSKKKRTAQKKRF